MYLLFVHLCISPDKRSFLTLKWFQIVHVGLSLVALMEVKILIQAPAAEAHLLFLLSTFKVVYSRLHSSKSCSATQV